MTSGALVAVTLQPASEGDTGTIHKTLEEAQTELKRLDLAAEEVVADKGYHSVAVLTELHEQEFRSYIPEPDRGRRKWEGDDKKEEQKRTYEKPEACPGRPEQAAAKTAQRTDRKDLRSPL